MADADVQMEEQDGDEVDDVALDEEEGEEEDKEQAEEQDEDAQVDDQDAEPMVAAGAVAQDEEREEVEI